MPNIPKVKIGNTTYDVKDSEARKMVGDDFCSLFVHATNNPQGGLQVGETNLFTKEYLFSPFKTYIKIEKGSSVNGFALLYNRLGGAYNGPVTISTGSTVEIAPDTPFRLLFRRNNGTRAEITDLNDVTVKYIPYKPEASLYFLGETPASIEHTNVTSSGNFNLIETAHGHIIANDASHASNNTFVRDFIGIGTNPGLHRFFNYYVQSHWHGDHCGLLSEFIRLNRITSDTIVFLPKPLKSNFLDVFPNEANTYNWYTQCMESLQQLGCTIIYPNDNDKYYIDGVVISFWNTEHDKYYTLEAEAKNYNDLSLCFYADIGNVRVGYPGDLGPIGQQQCQDDMLKCNIWNAEHHGWDNGVDNLITGFIDKISPDVVVADDGKIHDDYYETPDSPMVTWCMNNCVPFYRCYPQQTGVVQFDVKDGSYQIALPTQRYRRTSN